MSIKRDSSCRISFWRTSRERPWLLAQLAESQEGGQKGKCPLDRLNAFHVCRHDELSCVGDRLFRERGDAIGHGLNNAFTFAGNFQALKAQIIAAMARRLDGRKELHPRTVFDVRILHRWKAADAEDGHVDRGRLVFEVEEIGAIASCAGRQSIWIQRLDVPDGSGQQDLFQMVADRFIEDFTNRKGIGCRRARK